MPSEVRDSASQRGLWGRTVRALMGLKEDIARFVVLIRYGKQARQIPRSPFVLEQEVAKAVLRVVGPSLVVADPHPKQQHLFLFGGEHRDRETSFRWIPAADPYGQAT